MQFYTFIRVVRRAAALALLVLLLLLAACGGKEDAKSGGEASAALSGPRETVALYRGNCISCHAADLSGTMGADSDLRTVGARMSKAQIVRQITDGGKLMPAMKDRLTAQEIDTLAAWLAEKK